MMLPICSALTTCSSHSQISYYAGTRVFYSSQRAIGGRQFVDDISFRLKDGICAEDTSLTTHAAKFMHSLVVERPDQLGSDSSIMAPLPNEFDDIGHDFSNEFIDNRPENFSCSVADGVGFQPFDKHLKYMGSTSVYGPEFPHDGLGSDITGRGINESVLVDPQALPNIELPFTSSPSGVEIENLPDTLGQSFTGPSEVTSSLVTNDMASAVPENTVEISDTYEVINQGSLDVKESSENFLSSVTESLDMYVGRAEGALKSSYNSLLSSFSNTAKSVTDSVDSTISYLLSSVGNSNEQASNQFRGFSTELKNSIYRTEIVATDILRRAIISVEDSLSNAATFVLYFYGSAKSLLPPDFRNTLNLSEEKAIQVLRPIGASFQQVYIIVESFERKLGLDLSDPIVPFSLFLGSSAALGVSYWLFTYGGYSGDLTPDSNLELLKSDENAVLIDVRPEDLRNRDGVPDLRRRARSKYAYVVLPELDSSLRKLLKGGKDIDDALIAVIIRNLKVVTDGSKVIVMDATGGRSKAIARFLKKLGVKNPYIAQGGFQSWVRKGLPIKELKPETTLTVLNEEAEAILQDIRPTPALLISYGLGILAAVYALLEWERALQVIGIIGLGQTLYKRFASYEDSEDFKQDIRVLLAPVRLGAVAVSWAGGKLEPNKIGLPTSPSSSAVQDRVLQAAAKHEAQPSDVDGNEGLQSETSSQTNENLDLSEA